MNSYVFSYYVFANQSDLDVLASNQKQLEEAILKLVDHLVKETTILSTEVIADVRSKIDKLYHKCIVKRQQMIAHVRQGFVNRIWFIEGSNSGEYNAM